MTHFSEASVLASRLSICWGSDQRPCWTSNRTRGHISHLVPHPATSLGIQVSLSFQSSTAQVLFLRVAIAALSSFCMPSFGGVGSGLCLCQVWPEWGLDILTLSPAPFTFPVVQSFRTRFSNLDTLEKMIWCYVTYKWTSVVSFGKLRPWPNIGPSLCDSLSRWLGSPLTELIQIRSQGIVHGPPCP